MKALLDVNVLVALFDPMHVHHEGAGPQHLEILAGTQASPISEAPTTE